MAQMKKGTLLLGVAVLAGLVAAVKFLMPSKSSESVETSASDVPAGVRPSTESMAVLTKEGKAITTKASYKNPSGADEIGFTLYVDSTGMIVDAKADVLAVNAISKKRQEAFAEGFPAAVKGKKLSELRAIDRVGGSSLTTAAFNQSLSQLKSQI